MRPHSKRSHGNVNGVQIWIASEPGRSRIWPSDVTQTVSYPVYQTFLTKLVKKMERHRDPSTVEFCTLSFLRALFAETRLPEPMERFYEVPVELERLLAMAYPAGDDRAGLRAIIEAGADGDTMSVGARREGGTARFEYPAVVLTAVKGV